MKLKAGGKVHYGGTREVPGPIDLVPTVVQGDPAQSWSGCGWNSTALCWALGPLSVLAGRVKALLPPRGSQCGPGARGGPLGGAALLAWL